MKQIIKDLYWEARKELLNMKKTGMSLADRIAYEKALVHLEMMQRLINQSEIIFKQ